MREIPNEYLECVAAEFCVAERLSEDGKAVVMAAEAIQPPKPALEQLGSFLIKAFEAYAKALAHSKHIYYCGLAPYHNFDNL